MRLRGRWEGYRKLGGKRKKANSTRIVIYLGWSNKTSYRFIYDPDCEMNGHEHAYKALRFSVDSLLSLPQRANSTTKAVGVY